MKKQTIALWVIGSALYIAGCFWLYLGTLNFDGLDLYMRREDTAYAIDCRITALQGIIIALTPVYCLWLEYWVTGHFARVSIWCRRYGGCLLSAAVSAVWIWFQSHTVIMYPYHSNYAGSILISLWCGLILNHCIMRARRARIISR
ncbi:hypothetical protein AF47_04768 [Klebsiella aerogenes MGH 61]|nr:hypothetical protein AF47_04768 [Klebsiella aerogenes MGH 61]